MQGRICALKLLKLITIQWRAVNCSYANFILSFSGKDYFCSSLCWEFLLSEGNSHATSLSGQASSGTCSDSKNQQEQEVLMTVWGHLYEWFFPQICLPGGCRLKLLARLTWQISRYVVLKTEFNIGFGKLSWFSTTWGKRGVLRQSDKYVNQDMDIQDYSPLRFLVLWRDLAAVIRANA